MPVGRHARVIGFGMRQATGFRKIGGVVALFALWLQLVLTFGHMHADDLFGRPAAPLEMHRLSDPASQPGQDTADTADGCAICAAAALVAGSVLPAPASLPLPAAFPLERPVVEIAFLLSAAGFLLFRTLAPPARSFV